MNFLLFTILFIILLHWFADFVCQTHWQASNKSKNNSALLLHVASYTAILFLGMSFYFWFGNTIFDNNVPVSYHIIQLNAAFYLGAIYAAFNGTLHLITDFFTSRATTYLWKKGDIHNFFVVIGFDQFLHYVALFGSFFWLLGLIT